MFINSEMDSDEYRRFQTLVRMVTTCFDGARQICIFYRTLWLLSHVFLEHLFVLSWSNSPHLQRRWYLRRRALQMKRFTQAARQEVSAASLGLPALTLLVPAPGAYCVSVCARAHCSINQIVWNRIFLTCFYFLQKRQQSNPRAVWLPSGVTIPHVRHLITRYRPSIKGTKPLFIVRTAIIIIIFK